MKTDELRSSFLEFFDSKDHLVADSAPLVPQNDPSLLWINAGMTPLKPYFSGAETPPNTRMATSQKCIRTNDIENVGKTARHQTFFEMLGNFSFGDYFKERAIAWSWEYVTEVLQLPEDKLIITIFRDDDESYDIWRENIGVPAEKIVRRGRDENFWQIGTGPCGPCSEIHIDRGEKYGTAPVEELNDATLEREGDRFLELWNLVFTQYDYTEEGEYVELPQKNIDTGMGLERTASVMQGVDSNFETDIMFPIIEKVTSQTGHSYNDSDEIMTALRVISDHVRGVTMAVFDGVIPSNEGRGYVLRRLLRRASRYGRNLGYREPFLHSLVDTVIDVMSGGYPELSERRKFIEKVIKSEEKSFLDTLEDGVKILENLVEEMEKEGKEELEGDKAFELYDTYGFPLDLTRDMLAERDMTLDEEGFEEAMKEQQRRARQARVDTGFAGGEVEVYEEILENMEQEPQFVGYENLSETATVEALVKEGDKISDLTEGEEGEIIVDRTPFYAEGGGQVGDEGIITDGNGFKARVRDVKDFIGLSVHQVEVETGSISTEARVQLEVFEEPRDATARNHTATHLLHQVLMDELGDHVAQSGSLVAPERLRFDFTHFDSLTDQEIERIEDRVNSLIWENRDVRSRYTTVNEARKMGAQALFEEEYGEEVRVIEVDDFSLELCGGTHVDSTGEIGMFKILNESGIAAGVRRIEAATGHRVLKYLREQENTLIDISRRLNSGTDAVLDRVDHLISQNKQLERKVESLQDKLASNTAEDLIQEKEKISGLDVITASIEGAGKETIRSLSDELIKKLDSGVIILAGPAEEKVYLVARVSSDLVEDGFDAGDIIDEAARQVGGGGGGRPDMAQAGGSKPENVDRAFTRAREIIENKMATARE